MDESQVEADIAAALAADAVLLDLSGRGLTRLPPSIGRLRELEVLDLADNRLTALPDLGDLRELQELDLSGNRLRHLPDRIGELAALEVLDLGRNELTALPNGIARLARLRELGLTGNRLTRLPPALGGLTRLETLRLGGNALTALPAELSGLTALRTLIGLHEEPLMDPAFLEANPGYWSVDGQRLLEVYLSSPHGFGRGQERPTGSGGAVAHSPV